VKNKTNYETVIIEITPLDIADVITTSGIEAVSGPFNGEEDRIDSWNDN